MKIATAMGARMLLLLPMAFCIFVLLDNQDKGMRLVAFIFLVILEQIREWLLVSGFKGLGKGK